MNVLITGGAGFLGRKITEFALDRGYTVSCLSRKKYGDLEKRGVQSFVADLSDKESLESIDFTCFDAVIHTAALAGVWGDKEKFWSINYEGTKNLYNKVKQAGIKYFIYTSTPSVVFGKDDICLGDESLNYPKHFYTEYAASKAAAEKYLFDQDTSMQINAIRPHLIWGPNDPHLIPRLIHRAREGKLKQVGYGENKVDIIYVDNAAYAHLDLLEQMIKRSDLTKEAYFIGQENPVRLWDFINDILSKYGISTSYSQISFRMAFIIGLFLESLYKVLGILSPEPPMTRFVALQLAKDHYFSHNKAISDFNYKVYISTSEGLTRLERLKDKV